MCSKCKILSANFFTVSKMFSHNLKTQHKLSKISWKVISLNSKESTWKRNYYCNSYMRKKNSTSFKLASRLSANLKIFILNFKKLSSIYGNAKQGIILTKELNYLICLLILKQKWTWAHKKSWTKKKKISQSHHQK